MPKTTGTLTNLHVSDSLTSRSLNHDTTQNTIMIDSFSDSDFPASDSMAPPPQHATDKATPDAAVLATAAPKTVVSPGKQTLRKPLASGKTAAQNQEESQQATPKPKKTVNDYVELIETVARVEYSRLPNHLIDYSELVNIGAIAVHVMLTSNPEREYNVTYLSTSMKWAIRNELRYRYKWYSNKYAEAPSDDATLGDGYEAGEAGAKAKAREAVYETILSMDSLLEAENPFEVRDGSATPDELSELSELSRLIKECIATLPPRERQVLEARFYKNLKMREIGQLLNISPSRTSRIVQSGLDKVKAELLRRGYAA